jgi:hypothetical protein
MDDLRRSGVAIESMEEGVSFRNAANTKNVWRYSDIKATGGQLNLPRYFEAKNFLSYGSANRRAVRQGLKKEISRILDETTNATNVDQYLARLDNIHFVFRGSPSQHTGDIIAMLESMRKTGTKQLKTVTNSLGNPAVNARQRVLGKFI